MGATGRYVTTTAGGERVDAFVPDPLPLDPPLMFEPGDYDLLERANRALGRLDGLSTLLPDPSLFLYFFIRKEALLSSQIEGTQSSLGDLLLFESEHEPEGRIEDVLDVSNYVAAMDHGLRRIRDDGFPLSLRLLREIHEILLSKGRGSGRTPGEFRRTQNWIGGTRPGNARFVPPPPDHLMSCLGNLEQYLHSDSRNAPILLKAAIAHVQFETIHPFLDGNGRLGRLLITFLLCAERVLDQPLLYLSYFFKAHREEYYERLQRVRTEGDWLGWVRFFLEAVRESSQQAVSTARSILALIERDAMRIDEASGRTSSARRAHQELLRRPYTTAPELARRLSSTRPTARNALKQLIELEIVREITGRERYRIYAYEAYLDILSEGTEPL